MHIFFQAFLLFSLNLLDAVLTLYWVRNGFASEGNQLMASLLDVGDAPFLAVKLLVGATAALVLGHFGNMRLAKSGLTLALTIYAGLMGVHFFTALSAFGYISDMAFNDFALWSNKLLALTF